MPRNTSISLGDHLAQFIDRQVAGGRYNSASDVVRAGLRLLEERETKLEALRSALAEGEASGEFEDFDAEAFLASMRGSGKPSCAFASRQRLAVTSPVSGIIRSNVGAKRKLIAMLACSSRALTD